MGRHVGRAFRALVALALGLSLFSGVDVGVGRVAGPVTGPIVVRAATPTATPGQAGDTRSAGEGPGLVGAPGLAILAVLGLGLGTALLTVLYVRLSADRRERTRAPVPEAQVRRDP